MIASLKDQQENNFQSFSGLVRYGCFLAEEAEKLVIKTEIVTVNVTNFVVELGPLLSKRNSAKAKLSKKYEKRTRAENIGL